MGLPEIYINFHQKAVSAINRSEKGIACIIVKDDTKTDFTFKEYLYSTDVKKEDYTETNFTTIKRTFLAAPTKVIIVRIGTEETFAEAVIILEKIKYNWMCFVDNTQGEQQEVATYIKTKNNKSKNVKYKAITYNAATTDDMHIVNFTNTNVKMKELGEIEGLLYLPRLVGILSALPFTRSATYYTLDDLESVTEPENVNTAIDNGEFVLFNDDGIVRIARAVNSLKTIDATHTEDMQKITIVEAMDAILEDISTEFKNNYVGKYKNNYDNQVLFISAINSYFRGLTKEDILDINFNNEAFVDIEAQREAWLSTGKIEAETWDEIKVKNMTYKSNVFLGGSIKILDAIEDLTFNITMA